MRYFITITLLYLCLLFVDLLVAHTLATYFISDVAAHPLGNYLWFVALYGFFFLLFGLFGSRMASSAESLKIIKADILSAIVLFSILFVSKQGEDYSRFIVIAYLVLNLMLPIPIYFAKQKILRYPWLREKVIVYCDREGLEKVKTWFAKEEGFGLEISAVEMIDTNSNWSFTPRDPTHPHGYYAAIIAIESASIDASFGLIETLQHNFNRILLLPKLSKVPLINAEIIGSIAQKGVVFSIKNNLLNPLDRWIKNSFDFTLTLVVTIILMPILALLYLLILLTASANPIFSQNRIGKGGESFRIYKFRTMRPDADEVLARLLREDENAKREWEQDFKLKNDPRITPLGRFLRTTSLDELPQLFNVLRGEMSLVGPRPIVQDEVAKYGEYFHYFAAVRPGITGLWQVSGRNDIDYEERVQLDIWYVRNWSIDLDIMILIKTIDTVIAKKGSY